MKFICNSDISLFRILLLVVFFFLIKLSFFPIPLYRFLFLFLFLFELTERKYLKLRYIDLLFTFAMLLIVSLSLFRSVLTCDFTIPFYMFESIFNLFSAIIIYNMFYKHKDCNLLIREIVYAILFQSLLMLIMLISSPIKNFFNSIFPSSVPMDKWAWRHVGLTGFAAYNMGIFLALGILLSMFLFVNDVFSIKKTFLICLCFLVTALLTARSSFIVLCFVSIFFLFFIKRKKILLFFLITIGFLIITFISLYEYSLINERFKIIFDWMFSIFLTLFAKGKSLSDIEGFSVINENFYWIPSFFTFMFGDGRYSDVYGMGYYMGTDAGYMRRLLFFGFFMSVFFYAVYVYYFFININYVKNRQLKFIFISILFIILIMQYKGDFFIDAGETFRMSFLLFAASRDKQKYENSFCSSVK